MSSPRAIATRGVDSAPACPFEDPPELAVLVTVCLPLKWRKLVCRGADPRTLAAEVLTNLG